ncbi:DUF6527 family protein [Devosia neptuniae]|uniref:DUF6527 family protein n=1 Tax=Devosia neptuniae TaxID=191302 RepID=UPI0022AEFD65|nr:DUF6527 family protein [Devosia neptuniae]MCZ4348072.1 DUF6527 family protein [Devosia neptuniae]
MSKIRFRHQFVSTVPSQPEERTLYVSLDFDTMIHLCACGCRREVVTPLSPKDWRFIYDGETVSVLPSVGSWALPCRSHYFIKGGRVDWMPLWSDDEIKAGRDADLRRKRPGAQPSVNDMKQIVTNETAPSQPGLFRRIMDKLGF